MNNKQQILDAISQALDAMGMDGGMGDMYGEEMGVGDDNRVPIWAELDVSVDDAGRGPIHSKEALFGAKKMRQPFQQTDQYGMPMDDQGAEMMTALGMV